MECGGQRFKKICTCTVPALPTGGGNPFIAKWEYFFYAAFGIGFRVFPRFDNPTGACPAHRRQWADFLDLLRDVNTIFDFFA